jgi:hypothetical protein
MIESGIFIDPNMRNKIPIKLIARYNPLKDMRATMGVTTWEASKILEEGGDYHVTSSMSKQDF